MNALPLENVQSCEHDLPGGFLGGLGVLDEENLQVLPQKVRHALLNEAVVEIQKENLKFQKVILECRYFNEELLRLMKEK